MEARDLGDKGIQVTPPAFRVDITREVDLMEEVARLEGYDKIAVTYPSIKPPDEVDSSALALRDKASEIMAGLGFSEIITYSFISPDSADLLGAKGDNLLKSFVKLQNPLTIEQSVMRTSMLPGLLATVKENIAHGETDLKLFEWGKTFINSRSGELPHEKLSLAGIMTGLYNPKEWHSKARVVDFSDIKGAVEVLLRSLNIKDAAFKRQAEPGYRAGLSCSISFLESHIGNLGEVAPEVVKGYDLKAENVYIFEIDIEALLERLGEGSIKFEPFSNYPAVIRDLSIIVDKKTDSDLIRDIIKNQGEGMVESIRIFDLYEGEKIGPSKKAISFRIFYRSKEATLDGDLVNRLHESIIDRIREETGGTLSEG
jgi:phenylalanyl-tRNA synthetase beta chain